MLSAVSLKFLSSLTRVVFLFVSWNKKRVLLENLDEKWQGIVIQILKNLILIWVFIISIISWSVHWNSCESESWTTEVVHDFSGFFLGNGHNFRILNSLSTKFSREELDNDVVSSDCENRTGMDMVAVRMDSQNNLADLEWLDILSLLDDWRRVFSFGNVDLKITDLFKFYFVVDKVSNRRTIVIQVFDLRLYKSSWESSWATHAWFQETPFGLLKLLSLEIILSFRSTSAWFPRICLNSLKEK